MIERASDILAGVMRAVGAAFGRTNAPAQVEPTPLVQEAEEDDGLTVEERVQIEIAEAQWDNVAIGRMLRLRAETAALSSTDPVIGASVLEHVAHITEERRAALLELAKVAPEEKRALIREMRAREAPPVEPSGS